MRLLALLPLAVLAAVAPAQRIRRLLDADWRFSLDKRHPVMRGLPVNWGWRELPDAIHPEAKTFEEAISANPNATYPAPPPAHQAKPGDDVFHGRRGFAWFELHYAVPTNATTLHFESVDDNASVYIDGKLAAYHQGWNDPFDVPLGSLRPGKKLNLDVIVENTDGPGGIGAIWFSHQDANSDIPETRPGFDDSRWRVVHLPHDYVIEGTFNPADDPGHGALARTQAWYRRAINLTAEDIRARLVWIDFEGAYSDAHVWWNGHFLGSHRSGYSGFRFDLNKNARPGRNELAVHLDASKTEGWWYEGGGIYRHVWLTIANPIHIAPLGGVYVTTMVADPLAALPVAQVDSHLAIEVAKAPRGELVYEQRIIDAGGRVVARYRGPLAVHYQVRANGEVVGMDSHADSTMLVHSARLWSIGRPTMYSLVADLYADGQKIDEVTTHFGIRTIRYDKDQGFFLNGKPVKLKGTCNHQDFAGTGIGMPDSVLEWRIRRLKEFGSNAYRCSHNEVAPELLDACDRLGMVVMDENREFGDTWSGKANERTTTNNLSDLRQEVLRDRNHPSVIMWSLCNEEFAVQQTPAGGRIATVLGNLVRQLDPTRPITAALNGGHGHSMSAALDLEGFNYGPWEYSRYHQQHPDARMYASETASTVTDRGEYAVDKVHGYVPAYDTQGTDSAEDAWQPIAERPYVAGGFVWTGFDYKGEPTPYGWPCVNSHFGIIDMCGFWKDVAWYYKAWWGAKPSVHVFPHWTWPGQEGKPIKVWAFGNGDSVELIVNGVSQGRKPMPKYRHVEWDIPYAPGAIEVRCYQGDRLIATDRQETAGAPAALRVRTTSHGIKADGEDCAMLEVSVVDTQGRLVPNAANLVSFATIGPAAVVGVGNGDPSSHEADRASKRHAWHGLCLGILQAKEKRGWAVVRVTSPGLRSASITLPVSR